MKNGGPDGAAVFHLKYLSALLGAERLTGYFSGR